ncbi:hypothetical protein [Fluviicola taffensis]|uniref:Translational machinery protein n=1 Tax=Fluviicola taffensis (strain DSM 16823 / NCIMB 13979 / RW262) TaxID=755732 RepID=F2I9J4_FLUTR|nr:hypothetical protein [Fluviicola taffensis]AEA45175.1 hypothetical protein Fluta_3201 [Fluviicola taffensis DSM 16823]
MKAIGIWMDHSSANLIDLNNENKNRSIQSDFSFREREEVLKKGEKHMHNKEKHMHQVYYKEIANAIWNYNHILLFGPTDAKAELHHYLLKDSHFKNIQIDIASSDKMTDNQKEAFVKEHFMR